MFARRWNAPSGYEMWAVEAVSEPRVRLWFRVSDRDTWSIGHSKAVPAGATAEWVADQMFKYTCGIISQADYNTIPD